MKLWRTAGPTATASRRASPPANSRAQPAWPSPTTAIRTAWNELPAGTKSLVLICHDFDVPSKPDDVNQPDREIPSDLPRVDFFHWVLVDLPPSLGQIAEGEFSRAFTPRGKPGPRRCTVRARA